MKSNLVEIDNINISGIKHPFLTIEGYLKQKDISLQLISNNKKIKYELEQFPSTNRFILKAVLNRKEKRIYFNAIRKNEKEKIAKIRNNMFIRIKNKIYYAIRRPIITIKVLLHTLKRGISFFWREYHFLVPPSLWKKYWGEFRARLRVKNNTNFLNPMYQTDYLKWLELNEEKIEYQKLSYNPLISFIIPIYNISPEYLNDCINSILNQHYQNFEICCADDASTNKETIEALKELEQKDDRIKVVYRKKNGNISASSNSALEIAKGEFIALMDDDDIIPENALYEVVKVLNEQKDLDMIYTDEDKLDMKKKRCDPHFKPDFSPDTLLGVNYICHFTVLRKKIVDKIGGFRSEYDGAQDYDLFLRFTEETKKIHHIPKILYHWRKVPGSTAATLENKNYAVERGKKAVEDALKRRNIPATVHVPMDFTYYNVEYKYKKEPKISIIIPTKDYADILKKCIDSIYEKTTYKNFEILICDNASVEEETKEYLNQVQKEHDNISVVDCNFEFNYSKINNIAAKKSKGDFILLLNNDTEVITENWLQIMVGYAMQKHIGAVGVKLLYPDTTIQHAGVILGLGGVASHSYIGFERNEVGMYGRLKIPYNYSACTAACLMIEKKKFLSVEGLEETLKVAYNDVDLNMKLLSKGYYNIFLPQVELTHHESKSRGLDTTSAKYKRFKKEEKYMYEKWTKEIANDRFYNPNFTKLGNFLLDRKNEKNQ